MKERVQQRDPYCSHYIAVFVQDTTKNVVVRGSPRQTSARLHAYPRAVSHFSQGATIKPFLETT
jgi:hypothetical protein